MTEKKRLVEPNPPTSDYSVYGERYDKNYRTGTSARSTSVHDAGPGNIPKEDKDRQ